MVLGTIFILSSTQLDEIRNPIWRSTRISCYPQCQSVTRIFINDIIRLFSLFFKAKVFSFSVGHHQSLKNCVWQKSRQCFSYPWFGKSQEKASRNQNLWANLWSSSGLCQKFLFWRGWWKALCGKNTTRCFWWDIFFVIILHVLSPFFKVLNNLNLLNTLWLYRYCMKVLMSLVPRL